MKRARAIDRTASSAQTHLSAASAAGASGETSSEAASEAAGETVGPGGPARARREKVLVWLFGILAALAVAWTLKQTLWLTMPFVAAFFVAVAIWPVPRALQAVLPRWLGWLGTVAAMLIVLLVLAAFFAGIWYAASQIAAQWPQYDRQFQDLWDRAAGWLNGQMAAAGGAADSGEGTPAGGSQAVESPWSLVSDYAAGIVQSLGRVIAMLGLIFFFVLLMLIEAPVWRAKLTDATRGVRTDAWLQVVHDVGRRFRWYVLVRAVLGAATGFLYGLWLFAWGVDFAVVWGLLAFLLNFVPTLGSLLAGVLPVAFAFVQLDWQTALLVAAGILVIEQIMGNWIDPWVQGKQLSLSPLMLLFMLLVWGWIWGAAGALLAVPLTALLTIVMMRVPALSPIALALGNETDRPRLRRRMGGGGEGA
jgi:AI-2 transport protein TqsA